MINSPRLLIAAMLLATHVVGWNCAEAVSIEDIRINGYFDLEYNQANNQQGNKNGSFDNHHFNLLMDFPVNKKLILKSHLEFEHGADTQSNYGTVKTEWAFFEYTFMDELKLRGGKFFSPFGVYNEIRDSTPAFLSVEVPANLYAAANRGGFDFFPEQNTGLGLLGGKLFSKNGGADFEVDYNLYVGNGENTSATNPAQFDDNKNKAIGGRISLRSTDRLAFGVSFYNGDRAITLARNSAHNSLGGSLVFDNGAFNFTAEGAYSKLNGTEQLAVFAQISYFLYGTITPFYRYEYLDPNVSANKDLWKTHIAGLNINLTKGMYLKAEMDFHERGQNNRLVTLGQTSYHEFKSAIAIAF